MKINVFRSKLKGKVAVAAAASTALALTAGSAMSQTIADDLFTAADPASLVTKVGTFLVAIIAVPIAMFVYRKVKMLFNVA